MTREEEIKEKAKEFLPDILEDEYPYRAEFASGFQEGAKWADENPKNNKELLYVAQKTAERTKKEVINKFCKWIESTDIDMMYWNPEDGVCKELLIEDGKKAMEE